MEAMDITDANFEEVVIASGKTVVVEFGAEWCPPCKVMKPVMGLLASEFDGKALIGNLDVDNNPQSTARYGVRNLPTFLIFKEGALVDRLVGAVPKSVLQTKITSLI